MSVFPAQNNLPFSGTLKIAAIFSTLAAAAVPGKALSDSVLSDSVAGYGELWQRDIDEACRETITEDGIGSCRSAIVREADLMRRTIRSRMNAVGMTADNIYGFDIHCPPALAFIPLPHDQQSLLADAARVSTCTDAAETVSTQNLDIGVSPERVRDFREQVLRNTGYKPR